MCGITPAIGAVLAALLNSKCGVGDEQRITMEAATRVSRAITELTGPSCCKAYVRASLWVAADILRKELGISLLLTNQSEPCSYVDKHPHGCRLDRCPYYI